MILRSPALAAQQLVMRALAAAQAQEAVGQDSAFEESVEFVFDELRQSGAGAGLGVRDEVSRALLHQAVQRALLWAMRSWWSGRGGRAALHQTPRVPMTPG